MKEPFLQQKLFKKVQEDNPELDFTIYNEDTEQKVMVLSQYINHTINQDTNNQISLLPTLAEQIYYLIDKAYNIPYGQYKISTFPIKNEQLFKTFPYLLLNNLNQSNPTLFNLVVQSIDTHTVNDKEAERFYQYLLTSIDNNKIINSIKDIKTDFSHPHNKLKL